MIYRQLQSFRVMTPEYKACAKKSMTSQGFPAFVRYLEDFMNFQENAKKRWQRLCRVLLSNFRADGLKYLSVI